MGNRATGLLAIGALGAVAVFASQCGGSTSPSGGADASVEGGSSSGSSSGGSTSSGSGSTSSGGSTSGSGSRVAAREAVRAAAPEAGAIRRAPSVSPAAAGACVNTGNDPHNCGGCGVTCSGAKSYCSGSCQVPPCEQQDAAACTGSSTCCGTGCCTGAQLCCQLDQGASVTECYTLQPGETTCPVGCPACVSDRNLKRNLEPVDPQSVLERVSRMPIATWSYTSDDPSVRHMGMMAQDFYGEFGLGTTDKAFNPVDAHGVEMAAIQALYERSKAQDARIERLERENEALRARLPIPGSLLSCRKTARPPRESPRAT